MWVLSLDGDKNIRAFMAVFFEWFKHPEFCSARKVHHDQVDNLTIFIPMVRSCRIILATRTRETIRKLTAAHALCREIGNRCAGRKWTISVL